MNQYDHISLEEAERLERERLNANRRQRATKPNGPASTVPPVVLPFDTFDAGDWEGMPIEPRRWIVQNRIPAGEPGIMSGDGGTGKTKLMLQLSAAVSAEWPDWVGGIVETHGPVIFYSAEEKLQEMHRRMADILAYRGLSFRDLKGRLRFICDPDDVTLAKADHNGNVTPTLSLLRLEKTVTLIRPVLVVIEPPMSTPAMKTTEAPSPDLSEGS